MQSPRGSSTSDKCPTGSPSAPPLRSARGKLPCAPRFGTCLPKEAQVTAIVAFIESSNRGGREDSERVPLAGVQLPRPPPPASGAEEALRVGARRPAEKERQPFLPGAGPAASEPAEGGFPPLFLSHPCGRPHPTPPPATAGLRRDLRAPLRAPAVAGVRHLRSRPLESERRRGAAPALPAARPTGKVSTRGGAGRAGSGRPVAHTHAAASAPAGTETQRGPSAAGGVLGAQRARRCGGRGSTGPGPGAGAGDGAARRG